jgi:hypothetical protein
MSKYFLQIETVGPQGDKLIWVFFVAILIGLIVFFLNKKSTFTLPSFRQKVSIKAEKNRVYHPTVIHFIIENKKKKAIDIEHPVVRFKHWRRTKAFKIKSVNAKKIYPLYLEPGKSHELSVALGPFYEYDKKLKKFSKLRIEFNYGSKKLSSRYLLLKPTLFRSER